MLQYLTLLGQSGITPNFWTSQAYLERAGAQEVVKGDLILLHADGVPLFPTLSFSGIPAPMSTWPVPYCWSDFPGVPDEPSTKEFLDYEYIYDPRSFESMDGGKWSTFRKNCRKFPRRYEGSEYSRELEPHIDDLVSLLQRWASPFAEDATIHDISVILAYLNDVRHDADFGWKTLRLKDGTLVGINIWDRNWKYINFRYCFCDPAYDYVSEYMRWLFYTDTAITSQNRLVCDGGVVDRTELRTFKEKMNPLQVREVYSWGTEPEGEEDGD